MKDKLQPLRSKIDELDAKLVHLLNERTKLVLEIGKIKHASGEEIYAPEREEAVLRRVAEKNQGPLTEESLRAIYREVMSSALALEKPLVIAYLGPQATYSHMAAVKKFGASLRYEPLPSITDVFTEVAKGRADYGVVPIENSTEGAVTHTYDMFVDSELKVCAQIVLPIRHNLMAACPREQIKKLYSIAQVFAQCRQWLQLNMPHAELIEVSSSTRAAEIAKSEPNAGALASALAAELYGLTIYDAEHPGFERERDAVSGDRQEISAAHGQRQNVDHVRRAGPGRRAARLHRVVQEIQDQHDQDRVASEQKEGVGVLLLRGFHRSLRRRPREESAGRTGQAHHVRQDSGQLSECEWMN